VGIFLLSSGAGMGYLNITQKNKFQSLGQVKVTFNVLMAEVTNWKIGGRAPCLIQPITEAALLRVLQIISEENLKAVVVGRTTNLLFSDGDFECVIVQLDLLSNCMSESEGVVSCGAGVWVPKLSGYVASHSLLGAEHLCGIPASLGGLVFMNGGSQRKSIGANVLRVRSWDGNKVVIRNKEECLFSYRSSIFQKNHEIILSAELFFSERGDKKSIQKERLEILKSRRIKFPRKTPNCGSVFISNGDHYATFGPPGKMIQDLNMKGFKVGGARVSTLHGNFIENEGSATAKDVLEIINHIRSTVYSKIGVELSPEVRFLDSLGNISVI
jgi:UDP-N-acetylmuramate dehydrogenase